MTKTKTHDGNWQPNDAIDILTSQDQTFPRGQPSNLTPPEALLVTEVKRSTSSILGLDTEMLMRDQEDKILWPHELKLPQERIADPKQDGFVEVGDPLNPCFDFHGDGFAIELCVTPTSCLDRMMSEVAFGFKWFDKKMKASIKLDTPAVYDVPLAISEAAPGDVKKLGCMPSLNVYDDPATPGNLGDSKRTTGCHLHISHPVLKDLDTANALVKWADVLVGCAWTYVSPEDPAKEAERRSCYGRAGEHRLKEYPVYPHSMQSADYSNGVEYRVLPGTVMKHPAYMTLVFNLYRTALRFAACYGEPQEELSIMARKAINLADKKLAKKIVTSMPFKQSGMKLLTYLSLNPSSVDTLEKWSYLGLNLNGHRALAHQKLRLSS